MADKPISLRLTPELFEEMRQRAEAHGITVSEFIRRAVEAQLRPTLNIHLGTSTTGWQLADLNLYAFASEGTS